MNHAIASHLRQQLTIFGLMGAIGGFVSDVLQPLAPFSKYIFILSLAASLVLAAAVILMQNRRHRTAPMLLLSMSFLVFSGILLSLQTKESEAKGVLAANIPAIEAVQSALGLIQKDVAEIKETTKKTAEAVAPYRKQLTTDGTVDCQDRCLARNYSARLCEPHKNRGRHRERDKTGGGLP